MKIRVMIAPIIILIVFCSAYFVTATSARREKEKKVYDLIEKSIQKNGIKYCTTEEEKLTVARGCTRCAVHKIAELEKLVHIWEKAFRLSPLSLSEAYPDLPEGRKTLEFLDNNPDCKYYAALRAMEMGKDNYCWNLLLKYSFSHSEIDEAGEKRGYIKIE